MYLLAKTSPMTPSSQQGGSQMQQKNILTVDFTSKSKLCLFHIVYRLVRLTTTLAITLPIGFMGLLILVGRIIHIRTGCRRVHINQTSPTTGTEMRSVTTTDHQQFSISSTNNSRDTTRSSQDGKSCI